MANMICSFCYQGVDQRKDRFDLLIKKGDTKRGFYICASCVKRCSRLLEKEEQRAEKPKEIKAYLDQHIIGQDQAKKALAVAVYNHYKRVGDDQRQQDGAIEALKTAYERKFLGSDAYPEELDLKGEGDKTKAPAEVQESEEAALREVELHKGNILMIGPTGVGKTALAETLAELLDVPFVVKDATTLTEAGYVGEDVESIVKSLWEAADKDVERASRGIVVIDEVDKLARRGGSSSNGRDVGGEGVQQALLKIMESSKVNIHPDNGRRPSKELIQIDTSNILFIFCGAFVGLERIIRARKSPGSIGFGKSKARREDQDSYNEIIREVSVQDVIKFGLIPEFVGRLPVLVYLEKLDEDALVEILHKPKNSLVRQYQRLFELDHVQLEFTDAAMRAIVQRAMKRKSGARGLRSILEELMLDVMYELPDRDDVISCTITRAVVEEGETPSFILEGEESA
ncbi:MAG: ATP-dependent Clp protease ATP-binding subunit ClpX [Myxococcota bacterium]|nr:ATP-dependent Clp protease ATP-binding subunit ClpX [Myxococcota bacterium]